MTKKEAIKKLISMIKKEIHLLKWEFRLQKTGLCFFRSLRDELVISILRDSNGVGSGLAATMLILKKMGVSGYWISSVTASRDGNDLYVSYDIGVPHVSLFATYPTSIYKDKILPTACKIIEEKYSVLVCDS